MVQAMNTFTFLILILKINVLKADNNDILKHSASLTLGEYDIFSLFLTIEKVTECLPPANKVFSDVCLSHMTHMGPFHPKPVQIC